MYNKDVIFAANAQAVEITKFTTFLNTLLSVPLNIVRLTAGQQNGEEAPLSICKCVYLRVAPSARAANSLLLLPPYGWPAPPAELGGGDSATGRGFPWTSRYSALI